MRADAPGARAHRPQQASAMLNCAGTCQPKPWCIAA
jgi:hypothetical protein